MSVTRTIIKTCCTITTSLAIAALAQGNQERVMAALPTAVTSGCYLLVAKERKALPAAQMPHVQRDCLEETFEAMWKEEVDRT